MTERASRIGVKLIKTPFGLGVGPVVPFPATEAERTRAAAEASRAAKLLSRPSKAQTELFLRLIEASPDGAYVVASAAWIATILKATKRLSTSDMERLQGFDWTERPLSPDGLHRALTSFLKELS